MKNRKTVVVAFLLIATMLLGVGYAALTDVLDINGSSDVTKEGAQNAFDEDIYFVSAKPVEGYEAGGKNTAAVALNDDDQANFTADGLQGKDDEAKFEFVIANDSDVDAVVTPSLASDGNSNTEYFAISSDWNAQPKTIKAGQTATYIVTVKLLKTPTTDENTHGAFHIELTAVAE